MRQIKYWVRMNILDANCSWVTKCNHIGEAKLFGYILATFNQSDFTWTVTEERQRAIEQLYGTKRATMFNYLKSLKKNGLLLPVSRGTYRINSEYISYGKQEKK